MNIACDRCQGPTKPKTITSKKDNKQYTVYECQGNCMNGRFKYSCFAPKVPNTSTPRVAAQNGNGAKPDAVVILKSIDTTLKNILLIMQQKSGLIPMQLDELQPDEEAPF